MKVAGLLLLCLFVHRAAAQEENRKDTLRGPAFIEKIFDAADKIVDMASGESWTVIPAVSYSPETNLGVGVGALKIFRQRDGRLNRPSTLPISLLYTLNKQIIFTTSLDLWMRGNTDNVQAWLELASYSFRFYGIGNELAAENEELYATQYVHFHINYQKQISSGLYLGPRYEFRADDIYKTETGGMLDVGQVPGSDGQKISGLGLVVNFDTRNNIFQPRKGSFHQASLMSFQSFLGSNFTFNQYQLDFRKYVPIYDRQVLAVQVWYSFTTGHPPFQQVSLIGGSEIMRGYFEGRYRDRNAMVYQAEYRMPIHRKLGIVFFGSAGQVANRLSSFSFNNFKYGGGLGFRYQLTEDGLNFRLDLAYGNQSAFYFGLDEVL